MRHKVLEVLIGGLLVLITRIAPIATLVDAAGDHAAISLVAGNDVPDMCLVMRYVCSYVAAYVLQMSCSLAAY